MKVQKVLQEQEFTPIELRITIESQEEYDMIKTMMLYDVSIPLLVYEVDDEKRKALRHLMNSLQCL